MGVMRTSVEVADPGTEFIVMSSGPPAKRGLSRNIPHASEKWHPDRPCSPVVKVRSQRSRTDSDR